MPLKFDLQNPPLEYVTSMDRAVEVLQLLQNERVLSVDTETSSLDPYTGHMFIVQIATDSISYIFDVRKIDLKKLPLFKEILEDRSKMKILQNGSFDYKFIKQHFDVSMDNVYDVMLTDMILFAGVGGYRFRLDAIVSRWLPDVRIEKDLQTSFADQPKNMRISPEQLRYGAIDTLILFPVFEQQLKKLQQENLMNIAKLEFAVLRVVAEIELKGIYIDKEKWQNIIKQLKTKRDDVLQKFQAEIRPYYGYSKTDLFGNEADSINVNSQMQLMDLFNNRLKLNVPSTGDAILTDIKHPIAEILRNYRGYEKLISAFGESLLAKINPITGRIHPHLIQLGAATGRFACQDPNLQQIPRNTEDAPFRECFVPQPGNKLVVSDYSSFEMRILADLSGDEKMIMALRDGLDIHSYTAALMFGKEYSKDFKKLYPELRQMAKPIGFGLMYGMGAVGLMTRIKAETGKEITQEESQDLINRYFAAYPSVKAFLDLQAKNAVRDGFSTTPAGRKRWYTKPAANDPDFRKKNSNIERQAKNHPIQGTNADAIKYALVFVQEEFKKRQVDGGIILTVHDEIVCEVKEDQAEEFAPVLQGEMIRAGELFLKKVPVVSDPFVGNVWEH